ncbi:MAG: NCS2 family permease [Bacteroidales bacterium]|nr:NCS2 family permease [Bacteroidales bacterium]
MKLLTRLFGFDPQKHSVRTEILAGLTSFLTMAYILAVNPDIFSHLASQGMDNGAVFTATCIAAVIGTLIMALYAKKPFGLAPGMGANAFFVFTICLMMGYSWRFALTAVFIEGIVLMILTATKVRTLIAHSIPDSLKKAFGAGIGLFIAFVGLQNAGLIVNSESSLVTIGEITSPGVLVAITGLIVIAVLMALNVKGASLIGIVAATLIGIPLGVTHMDGFISTPPSVAPTFLQFEWDKIFTVDMFVVVCSFLFIDVFSTTGTLIGISTKAGMIDKDGRVEDLNKMFVADSVGTTASSILGTSSTIAFVESASGVLQGGKTGLTAFTTAICFALALFFAPAFLSIPSQATAPALIVVGLMMITSIKEIDFDDLTEGFPAFVSIVMMPLAYSISDGILLGIISYVAVNALCGRFKKISPAMWVLAGLAVLKYIFL